MPPSLCWKACRSIPNLLLSILFNTLTFKSKKLKVTNKPLSFPIPLPPHKSWRAVIFLVSDKVIVWSYSQRAHTEARSPQGTTRADEITGRLLQGAPLLLGAPPLRVVTQLLPPGPTSHSQLQAQLLVNPNRLSGTSPFQLGRGQGASFSLPSVPGLLFLQAELVFYKQGCLPAWPFQTFSLGNCSGYSVLYLIPVLLPGWQILNISW